MAAQKIELEKGIDVVRSWIDGAESVVALTGAGISTDSGIPDFRGPQGLWTKNPGAEKMATLQNYMADPEVRRRSWRNRTETFDRRLDPNLGHAALVTLERRGKLHALLTQNVDGLHHAAGNSPELIVEIHGTMREVVCMECNDRAPMETAIERVRTGEQDPPCRECGGILKSATISFGQNLVHEDMMRAEQSAQECDLMLAIGTTLGVYPIAGVVPIARQHGARVVILNAERTEMDGIADAVIHGSISEILPRLVQAAESLH